MFRDREDAGNKLAVKLKKTIKDGDFVAVALLRGGIVLGKKISDYFKIPLIPLSVKKIGAPLNSELAIGAVIFDGTNYFDEDLIKHLNVDRNYIKNSLAIKRKEAELLQKKFPPSPLRLRSGLRRAGKIFLNNKRVVVVDDGVATGATVICASKYLKSAQAKEIMLATPVISKDSLKIIKKYFDRIVALKTTDDLTSVSQFYDHFPQVTDEEVMNFLI